MLTVSELKAFLAAHRLRLSKHLGQHHLVDGRVIARLVASIDVAPSDTVVEIGAGLGALTEPLAARAARVIALEVDRAICALMAERMRPFAAVEPRCQDILTFRWEEAPGALAVGAIPYHITSPLLVWLFERRRDMKAAYLLLQREVAERLTARPRIKAYGRLTILCQYGWRVTALAAVPRHAFFPPPRVDSTWIRLVPHAAPPVPVADEARFFAIVRAAFSQRRKTLANCLIQARLASADEVKALLARAEVAPGARGEALSLEQFARLSRHLAG